MSLSDLNRVDQELGKLAQTDFPEKRGYEGALLMKKAGLLGKPGEKFKFFKRGRTEFDPAFEADSNNVELRFLRLSVQEHTPKIVHYKKDLQRDKAFILSHFADQPMLIKQAIDRYAQHSTILTSKDLHPDR